MDKNNQMGKCRVSRDVLLCAVVSWVFVSLTKETVVGSVRFILHSTQTRYFRDVASGRFELSDREWRHMYPGYEFVV